MTEIAQQSRTIGTIPARAWLVVAIAAGTAAGLLVGAEVDPVRVVAAVFGGVAAALVLWRFEWGIPLIVAAMPLQVAGRVLTSPVVVTLFQIALVLTIVSYGLSLLRGRAAFRLSAVDAGILSLLAAAVISLPNSLNMGATAMGIVRLSFMWLLVVVVANGLTTWRAAHRAAALLVATGVATGGLALAQYLLPGFEVGNILMINQGGGRFLRRVGAFFFDPNYMATFLSIVVLIALGAAIHARRPRAALAWLAASAVPAAGLFVSFSRTGWVGAAAGVVVLALTAPARRRLPLMGALIALGLVVAALNPEGLTTRVASIADTQRDMSVATRYHMFTSAIEIARDNWVFGTGLGAFDEAYPAYRQIGSRADITKPHQLPIALVAEMGIAGLIAEVVLIVGLVATFWRRRSGGWTAMESYAAAALVSVVAVQSWFQYYLYFEYLWFMVALAVVGNRLARADEEARDDG